MRLRAASVMVTILLLSGCADDPEPQVGAPNTRWDDLELQTGVHAALSEEVRIDGYAADLVPIGVVAVREDGLIAVSQPQDRLVRFFDEGGADLGAFGTQGEGPGEFNSISNIGWRADSLWVVDPRLRRVTLASPVTGLLRTLRVPDEVATEDEGLPRFPFLTPIGFDPDGFLLMSMQLAAGQEVPEPFRGQSVVARVDENGAVSQVVSRIPDGRVQVNVPAGSVPIPFAHRTQWTLSPDGSLIAIAIPQSLYGAEDGSLMLSVDAGMDHTVFSRRLPLEGVEIPQEAADAAIDRIMAGLSNNPELMAAFSREAEVPAVYPPVDDLILGHDGTLWTVVPQEEGGKLVHVLRPGGEYVGTLQLHERASLAAAEANRIWLVERDEFDVGSLVRYGVSW